MGAGTWSLRSAGGWGRAGDAGPDRRAAGLFSYVSCESRMPVGHPLRAIRPIADAPLRSFWGDFGRVHA